MLLYHSELNKCVFYGHVEGLLMVYLVKYIFKNSPFSVLTFQILKEYFDRCGKEVTGTLPKQWKCHRNAWGEDAEGDL